MLADLSERLARIRWPDELPDQQSWLTGTNVDYMKRQVARWRTGFDWRAQKNELNRFQQFTVPLAGIDVHFIHERGLDPAPLCCCHTANPGSVFECRRLIPMLTDPTRFGADPDEAFTVVAPSLTGSTVSFQPGQPRFGIEEIADVFAELMTDMLGQLRFAAQSVDWGSFISSRLGYRHAKHIVGIYLNLLAVRSDPNLLPNPIEEERRFLGELNHFLKDETGYQQIQGTRPQTLTLDLTDLPTGLAAWIVEKFCSWTDCDGDPANGVSRHDMLATSRFTGR